MAAVRHYSCQNQIVKLTFTYSYVPRLCPAEDTIWLIVWSLRTHIMEQTEVAFSSNTDTFS